MAAIANDLLNILCKHPLWLKASRRFENCAGRDREMVIKNPTCLTPLDIRHDRTPFCPGR